MPALIDGIIPEASYELIRDRLGEVLMTEIANQAALNSNDTDLDVDVYVERFIPIDNTETPLINICLSRGDYGNKDTTQVTGNYIFNIDVYTSSASVGDTKGDKLATLKLHRLQRIIRAILEAPVYDNLGFDRPFIGSSMVKNIAIADPKAMPDAEHQIQGRLEYHVQVPETVTITNPTNKVTDSVTQALLYSTSLGYKYFWSVKVPMVITTAGATFTIPAAYSGMELAVIVDNTQPYNSSGFTQSGDVITMTSGVTYGIGQEIILIFRINNYATDITIATAGNTITLPASIATENIAVIIAGNQAYNRSSFTQAGGVLTMSSESTYAAGDVVTVLYGAWLVSITTVAGNTLTLPGAYAGFEAVAIVNDPQSNTSISQSDLVVTMTDETTFPAGAIVNIIVR